MSLNKVTISGNLGADAELRMTKGGSPVVSFSLAVNDRVPQGDGSWGDYTNWIDCTMFGKRAESLAPWLTKGAKVAIVGHLHTHSYQKDGYTVKRWDVRVDDVELMQHKRDSQQAPPAADYQPPAAPETVGGASVYDSDIPF